MEAGRLGPGNASPRSGSWSKVQDGSIWVRNMADPHRHVDMLSRLLDPKRAVSWVPWSYNAQFQRP